MAKVKPWHVRYVEYFRAHNYTEVPSGSRLYVAAFKLSSPISQGQENRTYYVGKAGAVRSSKTGRVSDAYSVTDIFKKYVMLWELEKERKDAVSETWIEG